MVECGYADCPDHLNDDLDLWVKGASQHILVVIIAVWKELPQGRVAGHMTVYRCAEPGHITHQERVVRRKYGVQAGDMF